MDEKQYLGLGSHKQIKFNNTVLDCHRLWETGKCRVDRFRIFFNDKEKYKVFKRLKEKKVFEIKKPGGYPSFYFQKNTLRSTGTPLFAFIEMYRIL